MSQPPAPGVVLVQLGCEKNVIDGERMLGELSSAGYEICTPRDAGGFGTTGGVDRASVDLMVVNTCSFIGPAREESIDAILAAAELKKQGRVGRLGVAGCFAEIIHKQLTDELRESIDYFIGPGDIDRTVEILAGEKPFFRPHAATLQPGPRVLSRANGTAFLKIAEGCDKTCAFCTIPSFKGGFVSKPEAVILDEVRALAAVGVKEIALVSQDTASWGKEFGSRLALLVRAIDDLIQREELRRVRFRIHYLYPAQVTDELIDAMAECASCCPYFDMPIQHASPRVLRAMRRPPDPDAMRRIVDRIRSRFAESAIRSTVITGHPGETKAEFQMMMQFLKEIEFDRLGVFPYSSEPGTPAFELKAPRGAEARAREVLDQQAGISRRLLSQRVGKVYDVLMDTPASGRSALEAPDIDGVIRVPGPVGQYVRARVVASDEHDLVAEPVGSVTAHPERAERVEG